MVGATERGKWIDGTVAMQDEVAQAAGGACAKRRGGGAKRGAKGAPVPMVAPPRRKGAGDERYIRPDTWRRNGAGAARGHPRRGPSPRRGRGLPRGLPDLERRLRRTAAGGDRALQRRCRRHRCGRLRPQQRPSARRARRRPQHRRLLDRRRRVGHRPLGDARRSRRPGQPPGGGRSGRDLGGGRPRDPGARARDHRRARLDDRRRGIHARGRHRLADAQARPGLRQPAGRRRGHRRRPARTRERRGEQRSAVGAARRRRQLRHRHALRARSASGRTDRLRGPDLLLGRARPRADADVPRLGAGRPRGHHGRAQPHNGAAAAGGAGGLARQEGHRADRRLGGPARGGRGSGALLPGGVRAGRRPARADALPGDADADRPAVAERHQRLLQGDQPRPRSTTR